MAREEEEEDSERAACMARRESRERNKGLSLERERLAQRTVVHE